MKNSIYFSRGFKRKVDIQHDDNKSTLSRITGEEEFEIIPVLGEIKYFLFPLYSFILNDKELKLSEEDVTSFGRFAASGLRLVLGARQLQENDQAY